MPPTGSRLCQHLDWMRLGPERNVSANLLVARTYSQNTAQDLCSETDHECSTQLAGAWFKIVLTHWK